MCSAGAMAALAAAAGAPGATEGSHAQASAGPDTVPVPSSDAGARHIPRSTADGYFTDFKLCLSSPELVHLMVKHGHNRPLFMDATFGTNNLEVWVPCPFVNDGAHLVVTIAFWHAYRCPP